MAKSWAGRRAPLTLMHGQRWLAQPLVASNRTHFTPSRRRRAVFLPMRAAAQRGDRRGGILAASCVSSTAAVLAPVDRRDLSTVHHARVPRAGETPSVRVRARARLPGLGHAAGPVPPVPRRPDGAAGSRRGRTGTALRARVHTRFHRAGPAGPHLGLPAVPGCARPLRLEAGRDGPLGPPGQSVEW